LSENLMKIDAGSHKSGRNQEHHHFRILLRSIHNKMKNIQTFTLFGTSLFYLL